MNSYDKSCNDIKSQYDRCFYTWFSEKFLNGQTNDKECAHEFDLYQQCIKPIDDQAGRMEPCQELKQKYDACFYVWFSEKFFKGDNNDSECEPLLTIYKACVEKAMKAENISRGGTDDSHLKVDNEQKKEEKS